MEAKDTRVLLRTVITSDKHYIDACLMEDAVVICLNRETKRHKFMPFKVMYDNNNRFWIQNETWEYFFSPDDIAKIEARLVKLNTQWEPSAITETNKPPQPKTADTGAASGPGWGREYVDITTLPQEERVKRMQACKNRLEALIAQKPRHEEQVTEALVETTRDAVMHNHASLMSAMELASDDAKLQTKELVESTHDLVKASSQLISANIFNDDLMHTLVSKSDGTIIQHMTRVYLKGIAFLSYYNKLVSTSSIINKLRISFDENYFAFYRSLLPHIHPDDITLERVFLGGMRAIPENVFYDWAIGFLLHDIGKAAAVDYHEGGATYNQGIVMEHVNIGYASIINKTNYPKDAGLITGYHHEYYGDPSGYGSFRIALELHKKINAHIKQDHCIAYDIDSMMEYAALAFFPAKVLEIIDVYDALTDPNRKYRKALTSAEAIAMIRDEFIEKHQKVDPILFDLFSRFVSELP